MDCILLSFSWGFPLNFQLDLHLVYLQAYQEQVTFSFWNTFVDFAVGVEQGYARRWFHCPQTCPQCMGWGNNLGYPDRLINLFKKRVFPTPVEYRQLQTITEWMSSFFMHLYLTYDFLQMQRPRFPKRKENFNLRLNWFLGSKDQFWWFLAYFERFRFCSMLVASKSVPYCHIRANKLSGMLWIRSNYTSIIQRFENFNTIGKSIGNKNHIV